MPDVFDEIEAPATSDVFDEIAPEKKDIFDEIEGGKPVVREVQPGSIPPTDLFPAIRKIGGEIIPGQIGDTHPDIIRREGIAATDIDQRGFTTPWGDFLDRESAAQGTQLPTAFEPGRLHSTDLSKFQSIESKQVEAQPDQFFPSESKIKAPPMPVTGELSTTYGGTAKPVASLAETMVEPVEEMTTPRISAPKFQVQKEDTIPTAVGKEAWNIATSIPEFLSSNVGILSLVSGAAAPTATAAAFTADMLNSLGNQIIGSYKNWDKMAPAQKAAAITDMVGTGAMAALLAKGTAKGIRSKIAPEIAQEVPPVIESVRPQESIAKELGGVAQEPSGSFDRYEFPPDEPGKPRAQVAVPKGSPIEVVREKLQAARDRFKEEPAAPAEPTPAPAAEAKPEVATLATGEAKNHLGDPLGTTYRATPEDWAAWQALQGRKLTEEGVFAERERIKNKYGGMPPQPPESPEAPSPATDWGRLYAQEHADLLDAQRRLDEARQYQDSEAAKVAQAERDDIIQRLSEFDKLSRRSISREPPKTLQEATIEAIRDNPKLSFSEATLEAQSILNRSAEDAAYDAALEAGEGKKSAKAAAERVRQSKEPPAAPTPVEPAPAPVAQEPSPKPPTERLLIKPRTDGLVSLEDTKGNRISTHKTVEEAAKTASDLGYGIAPGSPLKPKKTATPTIVGLGAAEKGEAAPGTQIEQLTQALKGVQEKGAPLVEQVKDAFSVGDRLSAAKDTVGKALSGMKAAGDMIISKWKGIPKIDDLLRAKKTLSRAIESRGWRLLKWEQQARKSVPNPRDQAAIAKWIDSGGDTATLQRGLAEAPDKFKQAYQDALNLSGDKLTTAQNVQNYFESRLQEAIDAGVLDHGIDNYIHRMYESKPDILKRAIAYTQTGLLKTNPALAKKRFFQFDWEAEKAGYVPVQSFIKRITAYEASLSKAIAAREFIKSASEMKASDGRPVIDIKGVGIPIEDPAGVYREATLIKPKFNPARNNEPTLPNGNPNPNYRGDYVNRDYRALSRWKWVGSDAGGKPIYVQGDVAIHPEYANRVDALLKPSQVRYGKYGSILRPALGVSSTIKQTMLDLSGFHPVQIAVHGMEHRVMPWSVIKEIDLSHPDVEGLLQGGVTLGGDYTGLHSEGLIGSSLTRRIPGLGPVMESYHQWLFQDFIPRIKMTMALHALERNRARYAGRLTEEQIFHKTASEANAAFGELNYTVLERSKTAQDMARLILLAPDFLEARGRFASQAFQRGGKAFGHEQRTALLLGALTMWVTARIANKMIDGQYHNEPENLFNIVKDGHAYGMRTVQGDLLHLLTKPMQFAMSRLNPVYARTLLEALTGRDYFGRKRTPAEQVWDAASTTIPISLRSNRERKLWESMLNGIGVTARRYSDVDDAFKLAQKWKDKNAVPERGEFIYDPNKDILRPLKLALNHGDEVTAAKEIKALIDSKVYNLKKLDEYFKRFASMPFTGSKANDSKFIKSLTEDQRKTVEAARQHKNEIRKLYMKSRGQYLAPPSQL